MLPPPAAAVELAADKGNEMVVGSGVMNGFRSARGVYCGERIETNDKRNWSVGVIRRVYSPSRRDVVLPGRGGGVGVEVWIEGAEGMEESGRWRRP